MNSKNAKSLVAFFPREGKNIVSGAITDQPVGNTEVVARMIQKATGSDSFRIEAVNPYPTDYHQTTNVAQKEQRANARPELTARVENMDALRRGFPGLSQLVRHSPYIDLLSTLKQSVPTA